MLTSEDIKEDYDCLKGRIRQLLKKRNFEQAISLIELSARIAYHYNFLEKFYDEELESALHTIAETKVKKVDVTGTGDKKILFYDYFGFDNRGLTQQYLRALMQMDKEIVYVLEQSGTAYQSTDIMGELRLYPKATIYCLETINVFDKANKVIEIIRREQPSYALLHLAPWDVVACLVFNSTNGIKRFQINLTDHAFWLGTNITDVNIEFRAFGYNLSLKKRSFKAHQLKILPYYPIFNQHAFKGLPKETVGKKIIFSGGSVYKILGEKLLFLDLVRELLSIDDNLVFVYAGSKGQEVLKKFILENRLEGRIFFIGDRTDISAVLTHVDYFLTTFPFTGALITQIAAAAGKPILFFSTDEYECCNDLSDLFYKYNGLERFSTVSGLIERFKEIYQDYEFLNHYGDKLYNAMITPEEFQLFLGEILSGQDPFGFLERETNIESYQSASSSFLLEWENNYAPNYNSMIRGHFSFPMERRKAVSASYRKEQKLNFRNNRRQYYKNFLRSLISH